MCLLTFVHYASAQMRTLVLPLYASAHGATATWVGLIMGPHMAMAAIGSIPLGRASDVWGRRPLLLGGMAVGVVTSLLLPLVEGGVPLAVIFGLAGLGVAAFTPSALSLVGDAAPPAAAGRAYAWYSTAHYGAIAIGPFLGGLAAQRWGYRAAFVGSGLGIAIALVAGLALPARFAPHVGSRPSVTFADVRKNASVWAGWIAAAGGMFTQGVVFTFLPLLAHERGLSAAAIGFAFLVLGLANTMARSRPDGSWTAPDGAPHMRPAASCWRRRRRGCCLLSAAGHGRWRWSRLTRERRRTRIDRRWIRW